MSVRLVLIIQASILPFIHYQLPIPRKSLPFTTIPLSEVHIWHYYWTIGDWKRSDTNDGDSKIMVHSQPRSRNVAKYYSRVYDSSPIIHYHVVNERECKNFRFFNSFSTLRNKNFASRLLGIRKRSWKSCNRGNSRLSSSFLLAIN